MQSRSKASDVVIRERVETVIDAVEEPTGHVGVTVVEAVGHGRQRGITHEYRGRVFESRFLPKALLTFVVQDEIARRSSPRSRTRPAAATSRATASSGRPRSSTSRTTGRARAWRRSEAHDEHDLLIAASTIWVVVAAVLVMFMQAGFAFLEAGLTRMKNAGHIAGKNVLIFGVCSLVYWAVGFGLAFGDGNAAHRHRRLLPVGRRADRGRQGAVQWFTEIPGAAGYLFEVVFAGVSLAIVWGAMAERAKLWVYFAFGVFFTLIYSVVSHWIWSPDGWLFARGMQDFAGSTVVHYQGALAALAGALILGPRIGKFGNDGRGEPDPGPQHARTPSLGHADPLVRLVRLQPRLDAVGRLRRLSASSPTSR